MRAAFGLPVFHARGGLGKLLATCHVTARTVPPSQSHTDTFQQLRPATPAFLINLSTVLAKVGAWGHLLPRVRPYYAYKCNNDPVLCALLQQAGAGFDCASLPEIQQCLALGAAPADLIYANTQKDTAMLAAAAQLHVPLTTVDTADEVHKIHQQAPGMRVLLRIAVDDAGAVCRFSSKFGAHEQEWPDIMATARACGVHLAGVSFHAGSGASGPVAFFNAIEQARAAFDVGSAHGFAFDILDIGGGFPGNDRGTFSFADIANAVTLGLETHFSDPAVEVVAEPGRFFAEESHVYALQVIGVRELRAEQLRDAASIELRAEQLRDVASIQVQDAASIELAATQAPLGQRALFLNDGLYGCLNNIVFDHHKLELAGVVSEHASAPAVRTKLFGPTCDSIDVVHSGIPLPPLEVGDTVLLRDMGAYTHSAASRFNGFGGYQFEYVVDAAGRP